MIYSCFDPPSGKYRYFEDDEQVPVNGDLPVPTWLSGRVANGIGVPTADAGRPLPTGAKPKGTGFEARGQIVRCGAQAVSGLGDLGTYEPKKVAFAAAMVAVGAYLWSSEQRASGAVVGGLGVASLYLF